jgi:hypothetical protein
MSQGSQGDSAKPKIDRSPRPRKVREERFRYIEDLLQLRLPHTRIVNETAKKYEVSTRQVWTDLQKVFARMEEEGKLRRPMRQQQLVRSLELIYQKAMAQTDEEGGSRPDFRAALGALGEIAKVAGLYAPDEVKVEHSGDLHQEVEVKLKSMTSADRRKRLEDLLAKAGAKLIPIASEKKLIAPPRREAGELDPDKPGNGHSGNGASA